MTRSRRIPGALALAVTLAITAAACGDDDDGGGEAADTTAAAPAETTAAAPADTTAAPADTTEAPAETTAAPEAPAFQVPTDNCPPEATEPLADGEPVKIGFIGPQTGPLAAFGVIGQGMQVYFDKLNEAGGVAGHPLELIVKDDAYDPAKSGPAVQEALEGDGVFASVFQIGTPNVAGTRELYAAACVPQALVGTGFPNWGDPNNFPWTTGGIPSYTVESNVWTQFIQEKFPDATKVALLTFNNDFGKTYQTALNELLPAAGLEIVADVVHEPTSDLSNEVTQLLAAGPDVIIGGTTSTFCTSLMTLARQGGFTGPIINSYTCQAIQQFMVPAGEAAANVHTLVVIKDPSDPAYADDPGVQQYLEDVETYGEGVDPTIGNVGTGYNAAFLIEDAITRASEMEGGLTRANLMNAFWSFDLEAPLAIGGVARVNGVDDAYISEFGVMAEFDPATAGYLTSEGVEIDAEGEGGIFEG
ncbi:MAG TPA: ABC transporter substrate-binding protein [Acidimicrobiales bacterium]|jgi:ABC-type branched-subunit amino acid transport system substrate-binding protein|nr:ABC transporter substrate-binding protein [Acidimicrobiales bacterium]